MTRPPALKRQQAERRGHFAEARAAMMLRLKGYRILDQRWKSSAGEIDLVIRPGKVIAFTEVKMRAEADDALASLSPRQRRRIVAAAHMWLAANPDAIDCDCRFDIVLVTPYQWPKHMPNAFAADDQ